MNAQRKQAQAQAQEQLLHMLSDSLTQHSEYVESLAKFAISGDHIDFYFLGEIVTLHLRLQEEVIKEGQHIRIARATDDPSVVYIRAIPAALVMQIGDEKFLSELTRTMRESALHTSLSAIVIPNVVSNQNLPTSGN